MSASFTHLAYNNYVDQFSTHTRTSTHVHVAGEGDLALDHLKIHCHRAAVETVLRKVLQCIHCSRLICSCCLCVLLFLLFTEWDEESSSQDQQTSVKTPTPRVSDQQQLSKFKFFNLLNIDPCLTTTKNPYFSDFNQDTEAHSTS